MTRRGALALRGGITTISPAARRGAEVGGKAMGYVAERNRPKKKKKKPKSKYRFLLTVFLMLICGISAWNYKRNVEAEKNVPRPYQHYGAAQLDQLIVAYRADLESLVARYEKVSGRSIEAADQGYVGDQIKEFERVQRVSNSVRGLGYEISEREATLRELEAESGRRADGAHEVKVFLRRVFTY